MSPAFMEMMAGSHFFLTLVQRQMRDKMKATFILLEVEMVYQL